MNLESIQEKEVVNTSTKEVEPDILQDTASTGIPLDMLMTRREVAQLLRITEHCLTSNREKWKHVLPRIEMDGSNIIRYRRSDVLHLIEGGSTSSFNEGE